MGTERMKTGRLAELAMLTAAALIIFVVELQIPNPLSRFGREAGAGEYYYRVRGVPLPAPGSHAAGVCADFSWRSFFRRHVHAHLQLRGKRVLPGGHAGSETGDRGKIHLVFQRPGSRPSQYGAADGGLPGDGDAGVWVYFPFLLVSGCLAGAFTGICAQLILRRFSGNANR